jgi:hypothetical protein
MKPYEEHKREVLASIKEHENKPMKTIDDLREALGETPERVYNGMSMADLMAIFIQRLMDVEARSNDLYVHAVECRTKLEQRIFDLERKIGQLETREVRRHGGPMSTHYNHWTDGPR